MTIKKQLITLQFSEFKETMEKHSCPNCPVKIEDRTPCNDECIDCYFNFLTDYAKTKKDMKP